MRLRMLIHKSLFLALAAVVALSGLAQAESAKAEKPLRSSKFDPDAKQVDLFPAMEEKLIDVKLVAGDSSGGSLLITNKTNEPLTVKAPEGFVAVPANAQFGGGMMGGGMGGMGGGMGGMGGGMGGMGGGMGGQLPQPMGGGMGGMGGGMGGMGGMGGGGMGGMGGGGFFSIPAEKTLRVPFTSVCLAYGLPEPGPRSQYRLVKIEEYTNNPALQSMIKMVGTGTINQRAAQAATWSITDGLTWQQLSSLHNDVFPSPDTMMFTRQDLVMAQNILNTAATMAANEPAKQNDNTVPAATTPVRTLQTK